MATGHIYLSILSENFIKIGPAKDILYAKGDRYPRPCFSSSSTTSQTYDVINVALTPRVLCILHFVSQFWVCISWSLYLSDNHVNISRIKEAWAKVHKFIDHPSYIKFSQRLQASSRNFSVMDSSLSSLHVFTATGSSFPSWSETKFWATEWQNQHYTVCPVKTQISLFCVLNG